MEPGLELREFQAMGRADHYDPGGLRYCFCFDQLHHRGKCNTRLWIIKEAEPIDFGGGTNKFGFTCLFDDAIRCAECLYRFSKTYRIADPDGRRVSIAGRNRFEIRESFTIGSV